MLPQYLKLRVQKTDYDFALLLNSKKKISEDIIIIILYLLKTQILQLATMTARLASGLIVQPRMLNMIDNKLLL